MQLVLMLTEEEAQLAEAVEEAEGVELEEAAAEVVVEVQHHTLLTHTK